jgi:MtrB/PioB family decaheme-associated outer membrane protein
VLAILHLPLAAAQDTEAPAINAPDISQWVCEYCAFEEGWRGDIELGLGNVAEDSFKFGEYNGLNEEGAYLIGDAYAVYRGEEAGYLELSAEDIGLDSRSLRIDGGRQGGYDLFLSYDEIPHFVSDSASTVYRGTGGDRLSLPAGWVRAGSTAAMTELDSSLREVDLETQRKRLGAGIRISTESPWSFRVNVHRDEKDGNKLSGGAFFFNSAQLVEPVEYVTDEIEASVSYSRKRWQASLAYYGSTFSNENESLVFENPYNAIVPGADEGELALPPDNEFHQLSIAAAYQISERNHIGIEYAVGLMEQDEKLLQATLNPLLVVPALPADSADAEIETTNARLKFVSRALDDWLLSATYSIDERDNKTPQLMYDWVTTDAFVAAQRTNLPYSYTRETLQLKADFDYAPGNRLGVGYDMDERERTFQEVDDTSEDTLWGSIRVRNIDNLFLEFRIASSQRDASASEVVAEIDPPQNPLMTKYNLADRDRKSISMQATFLPHPDYTVGISLDHALDDYDDSEIGLTDSRDDSINIDFTSLLSETTVLNAYAGRQQISSSQAGSQTFAEPDWFADINDRFDIIGIGISHALMEGRLNIGADLSRSYSRGEIEIDSAVAGEPFPDLTTELDSLKLYLDYRIDENLTLQAAYWHEEYDSRDWALEDVDPDTVGNFLAFGEQSPSYDNDVVKLSMSLRF